MLGLVRAPSINAAGAAPQAEGQQPGVVDLEERSWLARHSRGDSSAFPALVTAYQRPVYSYLIRMGVAEADRDDLFQNIFLSIHAAAARYDRSRPLAPWLFTITANAVRNHFRERAFAAASLSEHELVDPPDPRPGPERIAEDRESITWLEKALDALSPVHRQVLLLSTLTGMTQHCVAESLNLPLNTVKTYLRRTRLTLAAGLAAHAPDERRKP